VYVSNRGHDSVGVFRVSPADGTLAGLSWESTRGRVPRAMALDPEARFLYVANQASHTIVPFAVDDASGALEATGAVIETGSPSSIVFLRR
jgi:6-phosphogluconolactonase (cycloisomerase 2 family)